MRWAGAALGVLFVALAAPLLDLPGIYNDEALFSSGTFPPYGAVYSAKVFQRQFPLMLMTYLGTVKSHLYRAVFAVTPVNAWSVRLPMILVGGITVALFFSLVRRTLGERTAWFSGALLATDATWIVTTRLDWGPVALQHLFLIFGAWSVTRFVQENRYRWLALGFFSFGLGCWDKALFLAPLAGLGAAAILFLPSLRRRLFSWPAIAVALLAFSIGAYPLIRYNVAWRGATFRQPGQGSAGDLPGKARGMLGALEGNALLGWVTSPDANEAPRSSAFPWLLAGCGVIFLRQRSRAGGFALVAFAVGWTLLVSNRDTGGSAHHTVLLWPLPHLFVGAVLPGLPWRRVAIAAAGVTVATNLAVVEQYYSQWRRFGGGHGWSDAIYSLAKYPAERLCLADWGMSDSLHLLTRGKLPLRYADEATLRGPEAESLMEETFAAHVPGYEFIPGFLDRLDAFAAERGYRRVPLATIADSRGRAVYLVFRYAK